MEATPFGSEKASPLRSRKNSSGSDGDRSGFSPTSCSPTTSRPLSVQALAHLLSASLVRSRCSRSSDSLSSSTSPSSPSLCHPPNAFGRWHRWWWTWAAVSPAVRVSLEMQVPHGVVLLWRDGDGDDGRVGTDREDDASAAPSVPTASGGQRRAVGIPWGVTVTITHYCTERTVEEEEEEEARKSSFSIPPSTEFPVSPVQMCEKEEKGGTRKHSPTEVDGTTAVTKQEDLTAEGIPTEASKNVPLRWRSDRPRWWSKVHLPKEKWWTTVQEKEKHNEPVRFTLPTVPPSLSSSPSVASNPVLHVDVALVSEEEARQMLSPTAIALPHGRSSPPPSCAATDANGTTHHVLRTVALTMALAMERCSWWVVRCLGMSAPSATTSDVRLFPHTCLALSLRGHLLPRRALDGESARERRRKRREVQELGQKKKTENLPTQHPIVPPSLLLLSASPSAHSPDAFSEAPKEDPHPQEALSMDNGVVVPPLIGPTSTDAAVPAYEVSSRLPVFSLDLLESLATLATPSSFSASHESEPRREGPPHHKNTKKEEDDTCPLDPRPTNAAEGKADNDDERHSRPPLRHPPLSGSFPFHAVDTLFLSYWSFSVPAWRFLPVLFSSSSCNSGGGGGERDAGPHCPRADPTLPDTRRRGRPLTPTERGGGVRRLYLERCGVHGMDRPTAHTLFASSSSPPVWPPSTSPALRQLQRTAAGERPPVVASSSPTAAVVGSDGSLVSPNAVTSAEMEGQADPGDDERPSGARGVEEGERETRLHSPPVTDGVVPSSSSSTASLGESSEAFDKGVWFPVLQEICCVNSGGEAFWMGLQAFLRSPFAAARPSGSAASTSSTMVFPASPCGPPPRSHPLRVLAIQENCDIAPTRFRLLLTSIAMRNQSALPSLREVCTTTTTPSSSSSASTHPTFSLYEVHVCFQKRLGGILLECFCQFPHLSRELKALILPNCGVCSPEPFVAWLHTFDAPSTSPSPLSSSLPRHYFHYWNLRWNAGANDVLYRACEEVGIRVGEVWQGGSSGSSGQIYRIADRVSP